MKVKTNVNKKGKEGKAVASKKLSSKNILTKAKNVVKGRKNNESKDLKKKLILEDNETKVIKETKKRQENAEEVGSKSKGVVYIGHIPHGFYEEQMREYFSQFGTVTNVRVSRSKKTGKSRGYGFIEFAHTEVAKIAAESMHNYLMFGRLIKTRYIPPERQHGGYFTGKPWSETKYRKLKTRRRSIKLFNQSPSEEDHQKYLNKVGSKMHKLEDKLKLFGVKLKLPISYSKLS